MSDDSTTVPFGTSVSDGEAHTLHYELSLPHPVADVWTAVASADGLRGWLATAETFEPGPGGAVTFRWRGGGDGGAGSAASGRITAWKNGGLVEYSVDVQGTLRFELEPAADDGPDRGGTLVHFVNDFTGPDEVRLDCLAGWHHHFEFLEDALDGRPREWSAWSPGRWADLRTEYASRA